MTTKTPSPKTPARQWAACAERTDRDVTDHTRAMLVAHRDHRITFGRAMLRAVDDRFVMTGPSGTHSLDIGCTDAFRLNAHWQVFATDPRNA